MQAQLRCKSTTLPLSLACISGHTYAGGKAGHVGSWVTGGFSGDPLETRQPVLLLLSSSHRACNHPLSGNGSGLQAAKAGRRKRGPLEALQENASVDATPAPRGKSHAVPFTPAAAPTVLRAPRLGEMFYSQTGPPLSPAGELP